MICNTVRNELGESQFTVFSFQLIELVERNLGSSASAKNITNVIKSQKLSRDFQATTAEEVRAEFAPFLRLDTVYYEQCIAETITVLYKLMASSETRFDV